ncbi:Internalin-A_(fragment) [Hexamita inflata]
MYSSYVRQVQINVTLQVFQKYRCISQKTFVYHKISQQIYLPFQNQLSQLTLDASFNQIQFLKPISGLVNLLDLYLTDNDVREVISLRSLQKLQNLNLSYNKKLDIWGLQFLNRKTIFNISNSNILDESPLIQCRLQYNFHIYNKFVQNQLLQIVQCGHTTKDLEYSLKFKRIQFATHNSRSLQFKMLTTKNQQQQMQSEFKERTVNSLNKIANNYNVVIEMLVLPEDVSYMQ